MCQTIIVLAVCYYYRCLITLFYLTATVLLSFSVFYLIREFHMCSMILSSFIIHSGCSSWTWVSPKRCTSWSRTAGSTGSVWGRKIYCVSTDYIKGRSSRPSQDWQWAALLLYSCVLQTLWTELPDEVYFQRLCELPEWNTAESTRLCATYQTG